MKTQHKGTWKRTILSLLVFVLLTGILSAGAQQEAAGSGAQTGEQRIQSYLDSGDIKLMCPGKTGGTADLVARAMARYLKEEIGKTVVVENKPGANGMINLAEYLGQSPNTTVLTMVFNNPFTLAPLFGKAQVTLDDFELVIGLDSQSRLLYVNSAATGIQSWSQLLEYGKNNFIPYGSGNSTNQYAIVQRALYDSHNIESDLIIVKGDMASLLGGHIISTANSPQSGMSFVKEGSIKPLMVFGDEPYTGFEGMEVPTAKSLGLDIFLVGYRFIAISKGTDQEIVDFWNRTFNKIFTNQEFIDEMKSMDVTMSGHDAEGIRTTIDRMYNSHKSLIEMFNE